MVSRYQRKKNKNVLFPFAFHCTGTPIVAAAQRVKEGEKIQINALKQMGLSESLIKKFSEPEFLVASAASKESACIPISGLP